MALAPTPVWSLAAGSPKGILDTSGNFVPQQAGDFKITATVPGGPSGSVTITVAPVSNLPPILSNITRSAIPQDSVMIQWNTNDPSDSQVEYGFSTAYGSTVADATLTVTHKIVLTGLGPGRIYHYRVRSKNASGKEAVSGDLMFTARRSR